MKTVTVDPHRIITLNDYPVYSPETLRSYINKCLRGERLALVPVIHKAIVRQHLIPELTRELEIFEAANPQVAYFMLDGSHRTTALTLTGLDIAVIIYQNDADIREAQTLVGTGQVLENSTLEHSLVENCAILSAHFQARPYFMTVHQKTVKMLREGYVTTPS